MLGVRDIHGWQLETYDNCRAAGLAAVYVDDKQWRVIYAAARLHAHSEILIPAPLLGSPNFKERLFPVHLSRADLGCDVTVGHGCVLHGCQIGDRVLVGMGSILLDNVVVGEDSLIAAGSLLTARMVVPPRSLVMGRPARVRRELEPGELEAGLRGAQRYVGLAQQYLRARAGG